jgi:hypothetical protein
MLGEQGGSSVSSRNSSFETKLSLFFVSLLGPFACNHPSLKTLPRSAHLVGLGGSLHLCCARHRGCASLG